MWSLGVTLFAMVTGRVPWVAPTAADLQRKVQEEPLTFPPRSQLSSTLKDLLNKMLDKNPVTRVTLQEIKVSIRNNFFGLY
jgi:serine/threonine protein kinase